MNKLTESTPKFTIVPPNLEHMLKVINCLNGTEDIMMRCDRANKGCNGFVYARSEWLAIINGVWMLVAIKMDGIRMQACHQSGTMMIEKSRKVNLR
jgi:hypothetical protein